MEKIDPSPGQAVPHLVDMERLPRGLVAALTGSFVEQHARLKLSSTELVHLLPYLGPDPVATVAREIRYHIQLYQGFEGRYRDPPGLGSDEFLDDIRKLASLPEHTSEAMEIATDIVFQYYHRFDPRAEEDAEHFPQAVVFMCERYDKLLLLVVRQTLGTDWTWSAAERVRKDWKRFEEKLEDVAQAVRENYLRYGKTMNDNGKVIDETDVIFTETSSLLRWLEGLHSKKVGIMLAYRVAGHILPAELVDFIGEGLYDQ